MHSSPEHFSVHKYNFNAGNDNMPRIPNENMWQSSFSFILMQPLWSGNQLAPNGAMIWPGVISTTKNHGCSDLVSLNTFFLFRGNVHWVRNIQSRPKNSLLQLLVQSDLFIPCVTCKLPVKPLSVSTKKFTYLKEYLTETDLWMEHISNMPNHTHSSWKTTSYQSIWRKRKSVYWIIQHVQTKYYKASAWAHFTWVASFV